MKIAVSLVAAISILFFAVSCKSLPPETKSTETENTAVAEQKKPIAEPPVDVEAVGKPKTAQTDKNRDKTAPQVVVLGHDTQLKQNPEVQAPKDGEAAARKTPAAKKILKPSTPKQAPASKNIIKPAVPKGHNAAEKGVQSAQAAAAEVPAKSAAAAPTAQVPEAAAPAQTVRPAEKKDAEQKKPIAEPPVDVEVVGEPKTAQTDAPPASTDTEMPPVPVLKSAAPVEVPATSAKSAAPAKPEKTETKQTAHKDAQIKTPPASTNTEMPPASSSIESPPASSDEAGKRRVKRSDEIAVREQTEKGRAPAPLTADKTADLPKKSGVFFEEPDVVLEVPSENPNILSEPQVVSLFETESDYSADLQKTDDKLPAPIVPQRFVRAKRNQFIDIPYPGKNWVFLGEIEAGDPPAVRYVNRVLAEHDTLFSIQAKNPGKTVLHFYKRDPLKNTHIDDYVEIEVSDEMLTGNERVKAADAVFLSSASSEYSYDAAPGAVTEALETDKTSAEKSATLLKPADNAAVGSAERQTIDAESVYAQAEKAFGEKRYADALSFLAAYEALPDAKLDKALFLRARIFESDSDFRNIRKALDNYEKIIDFFPESGFWPEAKKRSTYINRFYFYIR
ncbi:hypothetical protein H0R92_10100 [Treponema sp. OMZ 840]|uniref:hypothetical protein n=1 Tax=Treponema sp. OMZ 840 TaxID=244313 RepID=UPI003D941699